MLVEEVGGRRTDYDSGCWVGAHVDKIVEKHLKVTISIILFNIIHTIITFTTITTTKTTTIITIILNQITKLMRGCQRPTGVLWQCAKCCSSCYPY